MTHFLVCDIETLGMAPPAACIELGWHSLESEGGGGELGAMSDSALFGIPDGQTMAPDNRAVHHIDPAVLVGLQVFDPDGFTCEDADYAVAHNAEFEQQWLTGVRRPWLCTYKIALRLWPDAVSHSNQALKYLLGIADRPEHHPPHRALPDAVVTAEILCHILDETALRMPDASPDERLARLVQITQEPRLLPRCPIGKHRGQAWPDIPSDYLQWIVRTTDMEADLRWCADRELTRRRRGDALTVPLGDYRHPA